MGRSTTVKTTARSLISIMQEADPDRIEEAENPVEYSFSNGREFRGREKSRGAYSE